ncbi:O-methyltransferase [Paraliomyxa miuraensis]|uniref:O-methyltransferase n=1 Tax=Paraliomyxa miuraensis TaxID=376150 RepID=UPI0022520F2F|nr:class I SAM-dependent methyltransferase [Paraliomyxa miuraensis]MCX4243257.1 class I SAM-dependent methyltransferase [Paraliomyxa miuraensis]
MDILPEALERYIESHSAPAPPLLQELRAETLGTLAMPQMQVGPVEGALLKLLVGLMGAKRVLEVGTYSGYSALSLASGLPDDGRLVTCDIDPVATGVARRYFERSPHGHKIELRLGPAIDTIRALAAASERFDLVFLDADKESYVDYYEAALPMVPPGGLIVADNTLWSGRVLDPQQPSDHAIVRFNAHVAADDRVEHVLLSVRDGVMLARKRPVASDDPAAERT